MTTLEKMLEFLCWSGGTIHEARIELQRLADQYKEELKEYASGKRKNGNKILVSQGVVKTTQKYLDYVQELLQADVYKVWTD